MALENPFDVDPDPPVDRIRESWSEFYKKVNPPSEDGEAPRPSVAERYFSTGPSGVEVTADEWRRFEFPWVAHSGSIRATDDILVAFDKPHGEPSRHISMLAEELPFSLGSEAAVPSDRMWVKRGPDATTDPEVHIVALPTSQDIDFGGSR